MPAHLKVPGILLEDDTLPARLVARFAPPPPEPEPEPEPVAVSVPPPAPTLPPHYGTRELSLIARDPFTLFAVWDFSEEEILEAQRASASGTVVLRIFRGETVGPMVLELPVDPDRRSEFIPAPVSGMTYRAVLGLVTREMEWHQLASSGGAFVPPEEAPVAAGPVPVREPATAWITVDALSAPAAEVMAPAWIRMVPPSEPVIRSIVPANRPTWHAPAIVAKWSPVMAGASEQLIGPGVPVPGAGDSLGIGTSVEQGPSSLEVGLSSEAAVPSVPETERDFWFKVNAEVVVYGSTERNAKVTIDGRPVRLRADGSFSFRFSLPDGEFNLPITARAADGYSPREAVFRLTKSTERKGDIGDHAQDASLRPPLAGNAVSE